MLPSTSTSNSALKSSTSKSNPSTQTEPQNETEMQSKIKTKQTTSLQINSTPKSTKPIEQKPPMSFKPKNLDLIPLRDSDDDDAASDVSTENFNLGERVLLDGKHRAQVAYFGPVHFSHDDDWVGIAFEEPVGKHNGTVAGTEYFKCDSMHGVFVRSHRLQRTDSSGHVTARVKSPYRLRPKSSASMRSHELELEGDDIFTRAEQSDPLGFYEARAGTMRSAREDELTGKLGRVVEDLQDGDQVNFASPWIHSSRTPTPTQYKSSALPTRKVITPSLAKKATTINKAKPYSITLGYGEHDGGY